MDFNRNYYKKLIKKNGYNEININAIDFCLGNIGIDTLQSKWLCHKNGGAFSFNLNLMKSIVTTGVGISGNPHIGTLGQIFNSIFLQKNGINTQFVLGDLDAYNGKNLSLKYVRELSERYKSFILKLGYSTSNGNILRNQFDSSEITRTMYILAKFVNDDDFETVEEDLHKFYSERGKVDARMTFRRKVSLLLMASDFADLVISKNYRNVMVTLGIDEHKYVLFSEKSLKNLIDSQEIINQNTKINFSAMYTHIIRGFNGYPKMSKSFPESSISIEMPHEEISKKIMNENSSQVPEEDVVYQMMSLVSTYNPKELKDRYSACIKKGAVWNKFKREYVDYLTEIFKLW